LAEHRDFPTAWRRDPFHRTGEIDKLIRGLSDLGEFGPQASESDDYLLETFARLSASLMKMRASRQYAAETTTDSNLPSARWSVIGVGAGKEERERASKACRATRCWRVEMP